MCSMSMLCPLACAGAASSRGAAAKPAPRPKACLKKSRLFFMARPLQELTDPTVLTNSMDIGSKRDAQLGTRHRSLLGYTAARTRGENSDAKNAERGGVCRGRVRWAVIRPPCGCVIRCRKLGRSIQYDRAGLDYRHLRNSSS